MAKIIMELVLHIILFVTMLITYITSVNTGDLVVATGAAVSGICWAILVGSDVIDIKKYLESKIKKKYETKEESK